jgi:hypothetical protein
VNGVREAKRRDEKKVKGAAASTLFLVLLFTVSFARAEFVDRVVAAANTEVITASDLHQAVAFNEALGGGGGDRERLAAQTLEGLINRKLLLQEARRLRFVEIAPEDVAVEAEKLKTRLGSEKALSDFLGRLGMTRAELNRMLGERLLVERFIEKKISLLARVSHNEAQAYFDGHPGEFKGRRFSEVQKKIVAALTDQKVGRQVDEYLAELRGRAEIRINTAGE